MLCRLAVIATCGAIAGIGATQPVALTSGPGAHTEAAWSPDGSRIAFQREIDGDVDLCVVNAEGGEVRTLVDGPGHAIHPCWSPDGQRIVYSFAHITSTAVQGIEHGWNLFSIDVDGGEPQRLTSGLARDYTPAFSPDGRWIYFTSTRGSTQGSTILMRIPAEGGEPEPAGGEHQRDVGFTEPTFSPDGEIVCCAHSGGYRSNWTLRLLRAAEPAVQVALTRPDAPMYAPAWSPDGSVIACTGYRPGDPGWGIYLVEVATGNALRVDSGPGVARSPTWSPDGSRIAFESDRDGRFQLYTMPAPQVEFPSVEPEAGLAAGTILLLEIDSDAGVIRDVSENANEVTIVGEPQFVDGGVSFGPGQYLAIVKPSGMELATEPFSVSVDIEVGELTGGVQIIVVGDYDVHRMGWQVYLNDDGYAWFNSRNTAGGFVGARSDEPLQPGQRVKLTGLRRRDGRVDLYVDGVLQQQSGASATMAYGQPNQIRVASQCDGGADFLGTLYRLEIYRGRVPDRTMRYLSLEEFLNL